MRGKQSSTLPATDAASHTDVHTEELNREVFWAMSHPCDSQDCSWTGLHLPAQILRPEEVHCELKQAIIVDVAPRPARYLGV